MIEQGTAHISGSKKPSQVDAGEMLRVLDALDQAGYKVVRKSQTAVPPNVMINNVAHIPPNKHAQSISAELRAALIKQG